MLVFGLLMIAWALTRAAVSEELALRRARGGGPGSDARAPRRARRRPGRSSASTAPPKPPPTIRAPAAPAALSALDGALDLGHRGLVVVAQAGVRGVEQPAGLLEVAGAQRGDHRVDAGVLGEHVAGAGGAAARAGRRVVRCASRSDVDAERRARLAALAAALVVAGAGDASGWRPESSVTSVQSPSSSGTGSISSDAKSIRTAWPGSPHSDGELVEQAGLGADPVVLHARAQLGELAPVGRLVLAGDGEQREAQRGLQRGRGGQAERPASRSPSIVSRHGPQRVAGGRAARRRRRARTRASRRRAPARRARTRRCSPRSSARASTRSPASGSAVTVTPRSIANGSARPAL